MPARASAFWKITCSTFVDIRMSSLRDYIRRWQSRPKVRPWALSGPIVVLLICLPLLRPIRHPTAIGEDEATRLASVRAIAERGSLALSPAEDPSFAPA